MTAIGSTQGVNPTLSGIQAAHYRQKHRRRPCLANTFLGPGAGGSGSRFGWPERAQQLPSRMGGRCSFSLAASYGVEPSLLTLPAFPLSTVLHPTQEGLLTGEALLLPPVAMPDD